MASVFASPQVYGGSFRADHVQLIIGGEPVGGMVFQGINGSFATQISLLFELGSNFVYYVQGRGTGTAGISMILGPGKLQRRLFQLYGDACNPRDMAFATKNKCDNQAGYGIAYRLRKAAMNNVGFNAASNDVIAQQNVGLVFVNLEYLDN